MTSSAWFDPRRFWRRNSPSDQTPAASDASGDVGSGQQDRRRDSNSTVELSHSPSWVGLRLSHDRYEITSQLSLGGMADVYRAIDHHLHSDVVLKVPRQELLGDLTGIKRFVREIKSLIALRHPHIVQIVDVGNHQGIPFAVMPFLGGGSLEQRQRIDGICRPQLPEQLLIWLPSIAVALDYLHSRGCVHRDVKPANILFDEHGHAYLSDLGIMRGLAELSTTSASGEPVPEANQPLLGTPHYMAPELITGEPYGGGVDQYALGVSVWEVLMGQKPYEGSNATSILVQHSVEEIPPITVLDEPQRSTTQAVINRALAKNPQDRFPNCLQFAFALLDALGVSSPASLMLQEASARSAKYGTGQLSTPTLPPTAMNASKSQAAKDHDTPRPVGDTKSTATSSKTPLINLRDAKLVRISAIEPAKEQWMLPIYSISTTGIIFLSPQILPRVDLTIDLPGLSVPVTGRMTYCLGRTEPFRVCLMFSQPLEYIPSELAAYTTKPIVSSRSWDAQT